MDELLLHPLTRDELSNAQSSGNHALGLIGPYGAGKGHIATKLAEKWLSNKRSGIYLLASDDGVITIDMIRELKSFLKLKAPGSDPVRRVIIIEDAQNMTLEAQNAMLKILEEPPADARFVLTIDGKNALRPTIYSRIQSVIVRPADLKMTIEHFSKKGYSVQDISRSFHISRGYTGLCAALLEDPDHALSLAIADAKQLLSSTAYERLLKVDNYHKDKQGLRRLLFALKRVIGAGIVHTGSNTVKQRLISQLSLVHSAETKMNANINPKLLLTDLFLHL